MNFFFVVGCIVLNGTNFWIVLNRQLLLYFIHENNGLHELMSTHFIVSWECLLLVFRRILPWFHSWSYHERWKSVVLRDQAHVERPNKEEYNKCGFLIECHSSVKSPLTSFNWKYGSTARDGVCTTRVGVGFRFL